MNTTYSRWWHPLDEKAGPNPVESSPLPWTGDFKDGLGNKISMMAYANPPNVKNEKERADGYGVVRFNKKARTIRFECWPRFSDAKDGEKGQFPGWPITVPMESNDGRKVAGFLPELVFEGAENPVVQVVSEDTDEILYTVRIQGNRFHPRVYSDGKYTVKCGIDKPGGKTLTGLVPLETGKAGERKIALSP